MEGIWLRFSLWGRGDWWKEFDWDSPLWGSGDWWKDFDWDSLCEEVVIDGRISTEIPPVIKWWLMEGIRLRFHLWWSGDWWKDFDWDSLCEEVVIDGRISTEIPPVMKWWLMEGIRLRFHLWWSGDWWKDFDWDSLTWSNLIGYYTSQQWISTDVPQMRCSPGELPLQSSLHSIYGSYNTLEEVSASS